MTRRRSQTRLSHSTTAAPTTPARSSPGIRSSTLITNEPRDSHLGWHDGRNRNRLLAAAADLAPDWIFSLDADERLDTTDARALRQFVSTEALRGCAYGFQVYRMHRGETYDPDYEWVYRLFAFREGDRFPNRRLDFVPVPTRIAPERWLKTTLRMKHYGEPDDASRQRRVAKFREADPEGAFRDYYENLQPLASGPFPRWRPRPPEAPYLFGYRNRAPEPAARPFVVCLLPARNCAHLLPGWFESVSRVADAIVALDDGSTDDTGRLLREHPLVVKVLTNPARDGFTDWDDGDNRNRLLAAAAALSPTWIISVDADERIPLDDAAALRRFLHTRAEPGYGYALASYRMIGDEDHYDRLDYDAYRLFAFEPGHEFPTDRLHAPPIPTAIPPEQWRRTTIRMKHLVSLTEEDRRARWRKFHQADPERVWEPDYDYTIEPPGVVKVWQPRPLDLPALVDGDDATAASVDDLDLDGPVLTVVVTVEPGEEHDAMVMLQSIAGHGDVEILVATRDPYAADLLRDVAHVDVVDIAPESREAALRNAALGVARGDFVTFLAVGDRIEPTGLADLIDAHERGHGVVSVRAMYTAAPRGTPVGWAGVLLTGPAPDWVPASFAREALLGLGGFDDSAPEGPAVRAAQALFGLGLTSGTVTSVVCSGRAGPSVTQFLNIALSGAATWLGAARQSRQRAER